MNPPVSVSEVLLQALRFHDINQKTLAARAGVCPSMITGIISSNRAISFKTAYRLAGAIGYLSGPELLNVQLNYQIYQYENGLHEDSLHK